MVVEVHTHLEPKSVPKIRQDRHGVATAPFPVVIGGRTSVESLCTVAEVSRLVNEVLGSNRNWALLPMELRAPIWDLARLLRELQLKLDALESGQPSRSLEARVDFEAAVAETVAAALAQPIEGFFARMQDLLAGRELQTIRRTFEFFRDEVRELLFRSPFMSRTLDKPLGYAGDFEVMNLIYRNENLGASLFHKCIERFFLSQPEPEAVRNRAEYLRGRIKSLLDSGAGQLSVLSVASGPAVEIQRTVAGLEPDSLARLEVHLLDQDRVSLQHAQAEIDHLCQRLGKKLTVAYHHRSIKDVIAMGLEAERYDLIYSAGLFDYFNNQVASLAAAALLKGLRPGADLIIGNFDVSTPNAFAMSMIWDWNLNYRSAEDLMNLFRFPDSSTRVEAESMGINLFCLITKHRGSVDR